MTSKWLKGNSGYKLDKMYVWNAGGHTCLLVKVVSCYPVIRELLSMTVGINLLSLANMASMFADAQCLVP